ncbi:MAG: 7TM-DISM domain-containing protein, partial [Clostridiales bacterium]|nr:7TM-DISM domain-containing protein [Clostridiales bacterium]
MRRKNFNGTTKYGVYGAALIAFVIIMLFTGLFIINSMAVEGILTHKSNEDAGKFSKTAQNGLLDLGDWDLLKDGNVRLDGYWEFYWNELISPGDFNRDSRLTGFYEIPRYWTSYSDQSFPAKGSATYRLKVHTNGSVGDLSIKVPEIYSEYALWVNGELVNSTGIFKKTKTTYLNPGIYTFCAKQPDLEIVLQINNEADIFGGVAQSIILGESGNVYSDINLNSAIDIFVIAFCLFFGIYHLMLFIFRRKDMQLMFFSAFCITVCIRSLMSSESLIMTLFPHLSFTLGSRVATISVPLCAIFLMHFTFETFREETPRVAFNLLAALNAIFAVTVIVTPTYIYTGIFLYYLFIAAATCCLGLYVTFKAAMKKKPEAYFFIAGLLLLVAGACIDTLV